MTLTKCKRCGRTDLPISKRGNCFPCARSEMEKSTWQLKTKSGEYWEKWKKGMKRYAESIKDD